MNSAEPPRRARGVMRPRWEVRRDGGQPVNVCRRAGAMKRKPTAEQEQTRADRKARFTELCKRFAAMSKEERERWASDAGVVVTVAGHALSPRNTVLCYFQRSGVSMVGGFRQWLAAGRCVRKGEHGISILVPIGGGKVETEDGDEISSQVHFIAGTVFDVSQTDAIPASEDTDADDDTNCENTRNDMRLSDLAV